MLIYFYFYLLLSREFKYNLFELNSVTFQFIFIEEKKKSKEISEKKNCRYFIFYFLINFYILYNDGNNTGSNETKITTVSK